jgi:hypothetical protein
MTITRIGPLSLAKIVALVYGVIGLLIGAVISLFALIGAAFAGAAAQPINSPLVGLIFGVGSVILLPIFYGLAGFVTSLIAAWLYNVIAARVGGIEITVAAPSPLPLAAGAPPHQASF